MPNCENCGAEIGEARFCPSCGSRIDSGGVGDYLATVSDPAPAVRGFLRAMKICLGKKYANFSGKASRSEFWLFMLGFALIAAVIFGVDYALFEVRIHCVGKPRIFGYHPRALAQILAAGACLYLFLPRLAVSVRRYHDVGLSGWLYVFMFLLQGFLEAAIVGAYIGASVMCGKYPDRPFAEWLPDWYWFAIGAVGLIVLFNLVVFLIKGRTRAPKEYAAEDIPGFVGALKTCFGKKYASFRGRASRSEFWFFVLGVVLLGALVVGVEIVVGADTLARPGDLRIPLFNAALLLCLALPSLAVAARRFHDVGFSGWLYGVVLLIEGLFVAPTVKAYYTAVLNYSKLYDYNQRALEPIPQPPFINYLPEWFWPVVAAVVLAALFCLALFMTRGTRGPNRYGPAPVKKPKS
ncbi:MAG: DUF805 domain-containing protein [Thermoguttaceae bacterium]|nr:DUF805 domain-containing protein [Thermoguttaceae bacterium]